MDDINETTDIVAQIKDKVARFPTQEITFTFTELLPLITTIESQKEEIERLQKPAIALAYRVLKEKYEQDAESYVEHILNIESEIESLKAITELAVKEKTELFDESIRQKNRAILAEKQLKLATIGLNYILSFPFLESTEDIRIIKRNSSDVLEANERLSNVQT